MGGGLKKINEVVIIEVEKCFIEIGELDRVLSGGVIIGLVNIIFGDLGVGKIILLLDLVVCMLKVMLFLYCIVEELLL